ncbi:MAG: hypothetical protein ABIA66_03005, partial [Candidatus Omnitrophota bacterium]
KVIGLWPVGTVVLLSDNRIGIVRQENEDDMLRPKIQIINPQDKTDAFDLKANPEIKIERALNLFAEGKAYLHLI